MLPEQILPDSAQFSPGIESGNDFVVWWRLVMKSHHRKHEREFGQNQYRDLRMEPVLVDRSGTIIAAGKLGETHQEIFRRALKRARDDAQRLQLIDALSNDAQHRFEVAGLNGTLIFRDDGKPLTLNRIEAGKLADLCGQRSKRFFGKPLHSQQVSEIRFGIN